MRRNLKSHGNIVYQEIMICNKIVVYYYYFSVFFFKSLCIIDYTSNQDAK